MQSLDTFEFLFAQLQASKFVQEVAQLGEVGGVNIPNQNYEEANVAKSNLGEKSINREHIDGLTAEKEALSHQLIGWGWIILPHAVAVLFAGAINRSWPIIVVGGLGLCTSIIMLVSGYSEMPKPV